MDEPIDAATRKLRRLMAEAEGAQHNSIAAMALAQFNRELAENYAAADAKAAEEELAAMPAEDETEAEAEVADEGTHRSHSRRPKR